MADVNVNKVMTFGDTVELIATTHKAAADPSAVIPHYDGATGRYDNLGRWHAWRRDGRIFTVKIPLYSYTNSTACIKADDNYGLVCEPSTNSYAGRDDYARYHAFEAIDVNGGADPDGSQYVTAMGNDGMLKLDGGNGDVWEMAPVLYYRETVDKSYRVLSLSDVQHDGFQPQPGAKLPDGTIRPYMLYAKYAAVKGDDGKMASVSGRPLWTWFSDGGGNMSLSGQISAAKAVGAGYGGFDFAQLWYLQVMMWMKYATKSSQEVMRGCSDLSYQYTVKAAEENVSRVLLTKAQAQQFTPGCTVSVGERYNPTNMDRYYAVVHSIAKNVRVKSVAEVDADTYALNLDCQPITTTETSIVSSMPWYTGATDNVLGRDGSPTSNKSGKEPYKLQGIETCMGAYEVLGNVMVGATLEDGVPHERVYLAYDNAGLTAAVTDKWTLSEIEPPCTNAAWSYIEDVAMSADAPGLYIPAAVGGTSTTGHGDGLYSNANASQGLREWLSLGHLGNGAVAGLGCAHLDYSVSYAYWNCAGRLSALARSMK